MTVYNENKTEILTDYDLEKGYLKKDILETEIPEQQAVEEKWHYEVIKEYPNGGKDIEKVIDVEGKPYIAAHTETKEIKVYVPYTEKDLERMTAKREIAELKAKLQETDYQAIKYAEGVMSAEEYAETKAQRQEWRKRINELESTYDIKESI
jgi:hypothetical protein